MTVTARQIRALTALGITGDVLAAVVAVFEGRHEKRHASRIVTKRGRDGRRDAPLSPAERSRRYRRKKKRTASRNVTDGPPTPPVVVESVVVVGAAPGGRSRITKEGTETAHAVMRIFGFEPETRPRGWREAEEWFSLGLAGGWDRDKVLDVARQIRAERTARGDEGPPRTHRYLERPIGLAHRPVVPPAAPERQLPLQQIVRRSHGDDWKGRRERGRAAVARLAEHVEAGERDQGAESGAADVPRAATASR